MPNYTESLKIERVEEIVQDEKFFRQRGGFSILPQKALDKLEKRILLKDHRESFDAENSNVVVETIHDSNVDDLPHRSKVIEQQVESPNADSSSIFGSFFSSGGSNSNKLVGQHSY